MSVINTPKPTKSGEPGSSSDATTSVINSSSPNAIMQRIEAFKSNSSGKAGGQSDQVPENPEIKDRGRTKSGDDVPSISKILDRSKAPAKKGEEAQKDTPKDDDQRGTDGLTKEERSALLRYKKQAEEADRRIKELEQTIADVESTRKERDEAKRELEELREKAKERDSAWERAQAALAYHNIQEHPRYKKEILEPITKAIESVQHICKSKEIDHMKIIAAIEHPDVIEGDEIISEAIVNLPEATKTRFLRHVEELRSLIEKENIIRSDAKKAWESLVENDRIEEKSKREREVTEYKKASKEVFSLLEERYKDIFEEKEDGKTVKDIILEDFERIDPSKISELPADHKAYFFQAGHILPFVERALHRTAEKVKELEEVIENLSNNRPGPGKALRATNSTSTKQPKVEIEGNSTEERYLNWQKRFSR